MNKIREIEESIEELQTKLKTELRNNFGLAFQEIFIKYPNLDSISYCQYTPSWNDGDTCYFGVYADAPDLEGELNQDEYQIIQEVVSKIIFSFKESTLEYLGEGRVTINRDLSVVVEDTDHD